MKPWRVMTTAYQPAVSMAAAGRAEASCQKASASDPHLAFNGGYYGNQPSLSYSSMAGFCV